MRATTIICYRSPSMPLYSTKPKSLSPVSILAPFPCASQPLSGGPLLSLSFNCQRHEPLDLPPFLRSCSWKLLVQADVNLSIFSRKSGGKDLSSSIFFTVSMFRISQAISPERHIGPDSIWVEGSFLHLAGLSAGNLVPRNYVDVHPTAKTWHAPCSPDPQRERLLVLSALWVLSSVILNRKNKHERFKGEMDYYIIVYAFKWCVQRLIFISFQCGMEKKYKVLLV